MLSKHEVESLLCDPGVIDAVCTHVAQGLDAASYQVAIEATVTDQQAQQVIVERWKRRLEPHLEGLVAGVKAKSSPVEDLIAEISSVFDHTSWAFSPQGFLEEERDRVQRMLDEHDLDELLTLIPGKQLLPIAAKQAALGSAAYVNLICEALRGEHEELKTLGNAVAAALAGSLPPRFAYQDCDRCALTQASGCR